MSWEGKFSGLLMEHNPEIDRSGIGSLLHMDIDPKYFIPGHKKSKLLCLLEKKSGIYFDEDLYIKKVHSLIKNNYFQRFPRDIEKSDVIIDQNEKYRIVKRKSEKIPVLIVDTYNLSEKDKVILHNVQNKAISEISLDIEDKIKRESKKEAYRKEIHKIIQSEHPFLSRRRRDGISDQVIQNMIGYGLLEPLIENDMLEEIMVNGTGKSVHVYHRKFGMCKTSIVFETEKEIRNIINRIASSMGKHVDFKSPFLDARLADGSRVNATISPVSLDGPTLTIRKFRNDPFTIIDLIKSRTLSLEAAAFLWLITDGFQVKPANILITGGTGSGKTTTLNCICSFIPNEERVISIEDTAELQLPSKHWVRFETIPPNIEGSGEVLMDMLLKNCLRMNPSRIIIGEVRGPEAITLAASMNVGQEGCMGTIHSNTAKETLSRLQSEPMNVPSEMLASLNFIVVQSKFSHMGKPIRRITEISEVLKGDDGHPLVNPLYEWDARYDSLRSTGNSCDFFSKIKQQKGIEENCIEIEIESRINFLESLVDNDIRELGKVGRLLDQYYEKPAFFREIGHEISRDDYDLEKVECEEIYSVHFPKLSKIGHKQINKIEKEAIKKITIDPEKISDKEKLFRMFTSEIEKIISNGSFGISNKKNLDIAEIVACNMVGYGVLDYLLKDDKLDEIFVIGTGKPVFANHRTKGICQTNITLHSHDEIIRIINKIASTINRRIDRSIPLLDARLPDGSRVNATLPPVSIDGPTITIRKKLKKQLTITDLLLSNTIDTGVTSFLWLLIDGLGQKSINAIIAGGTGCGKTTLLNILCSFIPTNERLITIEDTAEIAISHENIIRLETKPPSVEDEGEVTLHDLVKNSLRMSPDRIIVGEVRGREAGTLFTSMNTGHDGCMGTIHANSASEALIRLQNPPMNVPPIMLPVLDLIIIQKKIIEKDIIKWRVTEIAEVLKSNSGNIELNPLYSWNQYNDSIESTGNTCYLLKNLSAISGINEEELINLQKEMERILIHIKKSKIKDSNQLSELFHRCHFRQNEFLDND